MQKKSAAELALIDAKHDRLRQRRAEEALLPVPGAPPRPPLKPAQRRAWNALVADLLDRRVLLRTDGPLLGKILDARAAIRRGQDADAARVTAAEAMAEFDARTPAPLPEPTPEPAGPSLDAFLAEVRMGRETFTARLVPGQALCLDLTGDGTPVPYSWPEGDPATVAKIYCEQVSTGAIPSCEMLRRACNRNLDDLQRGAEELAFDPLAARQAVKWFEDFCALKLEPWEQWIVTSLLGWKHPNGLRRFRECWLSCGRKNGKSALLAGLGLWGLVCDGEKFAEIYSAATKRDQAKIIHRDATRYVEANPQLRAQVKVFTNSLVDEGSTFQPLSSDAHLMDGLRPSWVLLDEIHEWSDRGPFDKLATGVSSRLQPMIVAASTAGESQSGFAYEQFELGRKVLNGILDVPSTFVAIYELDPEDDWRDEKNWIKSNPNLGVSVQIEALRKQRADAENNPNAENSFRRYVANQWITFVQGRSIPPEKWDACASVEGEEGTPDELLDKFLKNHWGEPCWGGFDLGLTEDMSAWVVLFRDERTGVVTALADFWVPEHRLLEKEKRWQVPLSQWVRDEWITVVPGDLVDPDAVLRDIAGFCQKEGHVHSVGFDAWNAGVMMSRLAERTGTTVFEVPQRPSTITQPAKAFKTAVWQRKFQHLGNPVLKWMAQNVVLEEDEKHGGMMAVKLSRDEKIDGVQALLSAWATMETDPGYLKNFGRGFATF